MLLLHIEYGWNGMRCESKCASRDGQVNKHYIKCKCICALMFCAPWMLKRSSSLPVFLKKKCKHVNYRVFFVFMSEPDRININVRTLKDRQTNTITHIFTSIHIYFYCAIQQQKKSFVHLFVAVLTAPSKSSSSSTFRSFIAPQFNVYVYLFITLVSYFVFSQSRNL